MQMEVNIKKKIFFGYWTYFTFMKPPFLIQYVNILFICLLLFLVDKVLFC